MKRSFLKWVGGKYNALDELKKHLPAEGRTLVEPFMGSCTYALNTNYENYILNDLNPDLVNLCRWAAKKPKSLIDESKLLFSPRYNTEATYYQLRDRYNNSKDPKERALIFFFINRHGHKGLIRYNQGGRINTPYGHYTAPKLPVDEIFNFSKHLKKARFVNGPFQSLKFKGGDGVHVYCDPPYLPSSKTASFSSYTQLGFSKELHVSLDKKAKRWRKRVDLVGLSNINVPVINDCYKRNERIVEFDVRHNIATNSKVRSKAKEVLLLY